MEYRIAIDGPSGAGKSTIAKRLSQELGFVYVDTGAMYRAIGVYALQNNIDTKDADSVKACLDKIDIKLGYQDGTQKIYLNGEDVSQRIRQNEVSMAASNVSAHKEVREFLLQTQRNLASRQSVIMDGRDIGTVVLPDAEIKIFLVADPIVRAKRRLEELLCKGEKIEYQTVLDDIIKRDYNDTNRQQAPLKQADDAVLVDTTYKNFEQSFQTILAIVKARIGEN